MQTSTIDGIKRNKVCFHFLTLVCLTAGFMNTTQPTTSCIPQVIPLRHVACVIPPFTPQSLILMKLSVQCNIFKNEGSFGAKC